MKAYEVVGYTADGDTYCPECIHEHYDVFGIDYGHVYQDREGNQIQPVFADSEFDRRIYCAECGEELGFTAGWWVTDRAWREKGDGEQ